MDDIKNACIESRRMAVLSSLSNSDSNVQKQIDDYFNKLEEFAASCVDIADFEKKFASSDLAKEYTELFSKAICTDVEEENIVRDMGNEFMDDVYHGTRRVARKEIYDKVRDIPGVGNIMSVKQHFDFFSRFKKKKNNDEK